MCDIFTKMQCKHNTGAHFLRQHKTNEEVDERKSTRRNKIMASRMLDVVDGSFSLTSFVSSFVFQHEYLTFVCATPNYCNIGNRCVVVARFTIQVHQSFAYFTFLIFICSTVRIVINVILAIQFPFGLCGCLSLPHSIPVPVRSGSCNDQTISIVHTINAFRFEFYFISFFAPAN